MPDLPLLITGANGQVGGAAARLARERGVACETPSRAALDLADAASIHRYMDGTRWRAILNCAAYTAVDRAESEPVLAHAVNAVAPGILADHAARQDCPIVHVSTDYVFDGTKAEPYVETDPVAPLGVYGASKAAGEDAVRAAAPASHVIVRTAWVLSAGGANFLNTMLRLGAERDQLGVVADQHGCPTNADDLADALLAILDRDRAPGTWHAVNGGETTWHGLACHIFGRAAAAGLKVPEVRAIATADYPTPARRPANSRLATGKLHDDFGLTLRPWQDAVDAILAERLAR
ncbi:dTDP-4-dehydrorhamnose reductase [Sphingopyxis sp.]|uniref:dTDP-4-dehydrorhamnose reductase n=1 Tax=Sphingopyxis sp. TaxID=1908224 RepID=UPI0035B02040